jgi:hypothetical protein
MTTVLWTPTSQSPVSFATGVAAGYRIQDLDGLGPVLASVITTKTPGQHGHTVQDVKIPPRIITMTFLIQGTSMADLWAKRSALAASVGLETVAVLNTFQGGVLKLTRGWSLPDMQITGLVTDLHMAMIPKGSSGILPADITFHCPWPFWTPTSDTTVSVPTINTPVNCNNSGDATAPVTYIIGPMASPIITNVTTGAVFKINATIAAGHLLYVYAGQTSTTVRLDNVTNWAQYIDHTQKSITRLSPGTNNIKWSGGAPTGALSVVYRPVSRGL